MPKRKAMVISKIENEHGCTLSKSDDIRTSGKSHAPPPLMFHIKVEVIGLNFRISIPRMNAHTAPQTPNAGSKTSSRTMRVPDATNFSV